MENKRKDKRFEEKNKVVIQFALEGHETDSSTVVKAHTHDISLGGARIISPKSYPVDTVMRIQINLSKSGQIVKVDGIVRWSKLASDSGNYELGVEFLHKISKSVLSLIRHLYGDNQGIPSTIS
ncbi:MAG: PilZ domain-containing protein [Candidatus Aminicenantes bacterium]